MLESYHANQLATHNALTGQLFDFRYFFEGSSIKLENTTVNNNSKITVSLLPIAVLARSKESPVSSEPIELSSDGRSPA